MSTLVSAAAPVNSLSRRSILGTVAALFAGSALADRPVGKAASGFPAGFTAKVDDHSTAAEALRATDERLNRLTSAALDIVDATKQAASDLQELLQRYERLALHPLTSQRCQIVVVDLDGELAPEVVCEADDIVEGLAIVGSLGRRSRVTAMILPVAVG